MEDFLRRTADYLYEHAPPGTIGSPGVEAGLARSCWVLAAWELGDRTRWPTELAAVHATPGYTVGICGTPCRTKLCAAWWSWSPH